MKIRALWDIAPCSPGLDRRCRGAYCLCHQGDDGQFLRATRRYIPEGCHGHTRRRENLKSYQTEPFQTLELGLLQRTPENALPVVTQANIRPA
jgi:hypothetical protein